MTAHILGKKSHHFIHSTLGQNSKESRLKYWTTPRPFARSLALLTRSLVPSCLLRSCTPLRSLVRLLAHFAHSLARGTVNDWLAIYSVFFSILDHSAFSKLCSSSTHLALGYFLTSFLSISCLIFPLFCFIFIFRCILASF